MMQHPSLSLTYTWTRKCTGLFLSLLTAELGMNLDTDLAENSFCKIPFVSLGIVIFSTVPVQNNTCPNPLFLYLLPTSH